MEHQWSRGWKRRRTTIIPAVAGQLPPRICGVTFESRKLDYIFLSNDFRETDQTSSNAAVTESRQGAMMMTKKKGQ
jgi:hypothetical protein